MDPLQFWSIIIGMLVTNGVSLYGLLRGAPLVEAQEQSETGKAYTELLSNYRTYVDEVKELRPLRVEVYLVRERLDDMTQRKEDWKDYAKRLKAQLDAAGIPPVPFRALPANGDTDKHDIPKL